METDITTSSTGLRARMGANVKNEECDYDAWLLGVVEQYASRRPRFILDVGCGLGKQTLLLNKRYPEAHIKAIDKSAHSLEALKHGIQGKDVSLICTDIDACSDYLKDYELYDLIVSSYAIYYSKDLEKLLMHYRKYLSKDGCMFLFGYGAKSNQELIRVINSCQSERVPYYDNFIRKNLMDRLLPSYRVTVTSLENRIHFKAISDFNAWFKSSELSMRCESAMVSEKVAALLEKEGRFSLTKETYGVILHPL
jgi:ubiquinone/menaquinone biosynthesis C-methylase UbiE